MSSEGNPQEALADAPAPAPAEEAPAPEPAAEPSAAPPAPTPARSRGSFWQWLWRGREIRRTREQIAADPRSPRLKRAQTAAEVAERAFDPVDPPTSASTLPAALTCYREAAYWALLARDVTLSAPDLAAAFDASPMAVLAFAAGGAKQVAELRRDFVEPSFVALAELRADELAARARAARAFVQALLALESEPERRLRTLRRQRKTRVVLGLLLALLTLSSASYGTHRLMLAPDLARGKPWRASSKLADCQPEIERCAGARTQIFFSTMVEDNPWWEVDLGQVYDVSVVDIDNRTDCCIDRARGLVVELSTDDKSWVTVARQPMSFQFWKATFPRQKARFVRLSVPKKTALHLEHVAVRER